MGVRVRVRVRVGVGVRVSDEPRLLRVDVRGAQRETRARDHQPCDLREPGATSG